MFLFSGQGSQYYQMGQQLFEQNENFRSWMVTLDQVAQRILNESILNKIYDDKEKGLAFDRTLYTHPAIFMVEYALARTLITEGIMPDVVLGCSLGEFAAATIAGVIHMEEALELVIHQALLFERKCEPGSMLAVLHEIPLLHEIQAKYPMIEPVAVNYDAHFVVSGSKGDIHALYTDLKNKNILCDPLPVSFAFHSSLINEIANDYKKMLQKKNFLSPNIPMMSSVDGNFVNKLSDDYFWQVVRKPIQFAKALQPLDRVSHRHYIDCGPGGTLANFTRRNIKSDATCHAIVTPFNQEINNLSRISEWYASINL
ncbi:bacillaene synthase trans-acting acyltransferase/trans-AT polyketide synthase, acyltransferase and oxidoreductase domain-containing protein [Marininema halotolerans]|uniref:Bacillaene synthase trans-acting acyltransferase/trans-AT polyketide synthase, acyltransferase and oxidoreductase domain-containing protein n=1 Tax=Marininema halotolerans TaxID=1155944 RepID=A0A1I6PQV5_9BACL|nr:bacillaene synthase trans-acting acyltransferase/trans-AT polyketide synthase, acyltransferase and oxidoreductase domain-containing protein [Marininema halotolerans]